MPILIRIILQRLLLSVFSILAFFGINPDLSVPTDVAIEERKDVQQERVEEVLQIKEDQSTQKSPSTDAIKDVEEKITEIQKEFTDTITQSLVNTSKDIVPDNLVYNQENISFDIKNVVVNIMCLEKTKTYTRLSSGSGVIISPAGIILTNAHVTYPFLKTSQFDSSIYSCTIRRENIPNFGYNAELVYYPIDWLVRNSEIIKEATPVGTGENDYALLQITSALGPVPKANEFPYASVNVTSKNLITNISVTAAGYPSSNSGVFELDANPGLKTAQTTIKDFFTFGTRSYDVLQTDVNIVAHRGASGGGIFSSSYLYGIVVTTNSNAQGSYINALTLPYIKEDFEKDTGISFDSFINYSKEDLKSRFNTTYKAKLEEFISSGN